MDEGMNRKERRLARKSGKLDNTAFLKVADKFIDLANRQNKHVQATDLHNAFLYAAARYNAFVANSMLHVENHEEFVQEMVKQYADMLRQNLADPNLAGTEQSGAG